MTHGIALLICGVTLVVVSFIMAGRGATKSVDAAVKIRTKQLQDDLQKRINMTKRQRLDALKQHYLAELVEDPLDGTPFDMEVLRALETLENRYLNE